MVAFKLPHWVSLALQGKLTMEYIPIKCITHLNNIRHIPVFWYFSSISLNTLDFIRYMQDKRPVIHSSNVVHEVFTVGFSGSQCYHIHDMKLVTQWVLAVFVHGSDWNWCCLFSKHSFEIPILMVSGRATTETANEVFIVVDIGPKGKLMSMFHIKLCLLTLKKIT